MGNHIRRLSALVLPGVLALAGGCATPGLRFEILQPPVLLGNTQSVVQSTGSTISTQPNGSFVSPLGMPSTSMMMIPTTSVTGVSANPTARLDYTPTARLDYTPSVSGCTLEDVCRRIQALEASRPAIRIAPQPERLPTPKLVTPPPPGMAPADCQ